MFRATTPTAAVASTVALLGLTLLAPSGAVAAAETCQGTPATIVGAPGDRELRGTEGADVVVTNDATFVWGLGGDDLICVTGSNWAARVDAGDGHDTVDATAARSGSTTVLGPGADRFTGSAFAESVTAGTDATPSLDTETDVIEARGDYDDVVVSGQTGVPNSDHVSLGRGSLTWRGIPTATSVLDGGRYSRLALELGAPGEAVLDNGAGTLTREGAPTLGFTGFTQFDIVTSYGSGPFRFVGTDTSEALTLSAWRFLDHRVDMRGGSDRLWVSSAYGLHSDTSYDGGVGARDQLTLTLPRQEEVALDLRRERLTTGWGDRDNTTRARGFESAGVMAQRVDVVGTARKNTLSVEACRARVEGLGGADRISDYRQDTDETLPCRGRRATFVGGAGGDLLHGTSGPDRLLGGGGRDEAQGRQGRDVCEAEERHGCEARL
jgi:Ca2+-binding RTX toxin-like protein